MLGLVGYRELGDSPIHHRDLQYISRLSQYLMRLSKLKRVIISAICYPACASSTLVRD